MPPKPKFTKEEVINAALELVSEKGMEALTARNLGARLNSSARPIFTVFKNMEELQQEVRNAALKKYEGFARKAINYTPAFKQFGMQMILFAMEEPKLYQLLFMREKADARNFDDVFADLGEIADICIDVIQKDYGLSLHEAKILFQHVWIHTFGIGALCASRACRFSEEEIIEMLGHDFVAMLIMIKSGKMNEPTEQPVLKMEDK